MADVRVARIVLNAAYAPRGCWLRDALRFSQMGSDGDEDDLEQIARIFRDDVLKPMMSAGASPEEIKKLVARLQEKLDAFKTMNDLDGEPSGEASAATKTAKPYSAATSAITSPEMILGHELGRNQRSKLREIVLLLVLAQEQRAYPLHQLISEVDRHGLDSSKPAVISHLNRLISLGLLATPSKGSGMYSITPQGLTHLQRLRTDFGHLLPESAA